MVVDLFHALVLFLTSFIVGLLVQLCAGLHDHCAASCSVSDVNAGGCFGTHAYGGGLGISAEVLSDLRTGSAHSFSALRHVAE